MQLEKQVCSLELAKKLRELGVKQESLWIWAYPIYPLPNRPHPDWQLFPTVFGPIEIADGERYSACTVTELGEMLPRATNIDKNVESWTVGVVINDEWYSRDADTEADARAKVVIYLLENELIKCSA